MGSTAATILLGAALLVGCATPPPEQETTGRETSEQQDRGNLQLCRDLVGAEPDAWPRLWSRVQSLGPNVAPALIRAISENPAGSGAQAGVHLLGVLEVEDTRTFLEETLRAGGSLAPEAALSLAKLGGPASVVALRSAVDARDRSTATRAAAAAGLVDLGEARSILPFLEALFLAATPFGAETGPEQGLPRTKVRWAHERYMVIEALRRRYDGQSFGLDEDSSWPRMREGTARMKKYISENG